jgi:serine protease
VKLFSFHSPDIIGRSLIEFVRFFVLRFAVPTERIAFARFRFVAVGAVFVVATYAGLFASLARAATPSEVETADVNGLIVKFDEKVAARSAELASVEARAASVSRAMQRVASTLSTRMGRATYARTLANDAELYRFDAPATLTEAQTLARAVESISGVTYATPNRRMKTQAVPLDAEYNLQWGFRLNANEQGANFEAAWNTTRGDPNQTIGVIDSGLARAHPELATQFRTHPSFPNGGYDFMTNAAGAGDGDGRDNNPEQSANSCGHGSHVSGTIAAQTAFDANGVAVGVAGGASASKVLMARGLDFTGDEADIVDAMLWLAGAPVAGVATNPNPVRLINMSLGGAGACGPAYADAVSTLASRGALVIAAAGNSTSDVANFAPANCAGVVAVAASSIGGSRAGFSNFGTGVTITAPGDSIYSTGGSTGENCVKSGTSMAAPHVTAALALAQTVNTWISNSQSLLALRASARDFPAGSNCTTQTCGAGLLDAKRLIDQVAPGATPAVGWISSALSARENDGNVSLKVARIGSAAAPTNVTVAVFSGTATSGVDFGAPSPTTISWNAGDVSERTVTIPITYRPGEQGVRQFSVALINPSAGTSIVAPDNVQIRITEVDCNNVFPIAIGETRDGDLGIVGNTYCRGGVRGPEFNTVRYRFTANAGDIVSIALNSTTPVGSVLDPYVYLLDSNLRIVTENDDIVAGTLRNALIDGFTIPATGTYYIDATTWSPTQENIGTYRLELRSCGAYVGSATCNLDVDGDGRFDRNDATIAVRRMLGFSGAALNADVSHRSCAARTSTNNIETFLATQLGNTPPSYDVDGDGVIRAETDGLILLRIALGMRGDAVVANATAPWATRGTSALVLDYLSNVCNLR